MTHILIELSQQFQCIYVLSQLRTIAQCMGIEATYVFNNAVTVVALTTRRFIFFIR